jgi:hypothetical protein
MRKAIFLLLAVALLLPYACRESKPASTDDPENLTTQTSADSNQDGLITAKDDLNGDGFPDEHDEKVLGLLLSGIEAYLPQLAELQLEPNLHTLERWESEHITSVSPDATIYAVALLGQEGMSGYLVWAVNGATFQSLSYGVYQNTLGQAIFFDIAHPVALRVDLDAHQMSVAADDDDYWECAGECIKDELDGFAGSVCASICVACVVEPTKITCGGCIACFGVVIAGCLIWCAW